MRVLPSGNGTIVLTKDGAETTLDLTAEAETSVGEAEVETTTQAVTLADLGYSSAVIYDSNNQQIEDIVSHEFTYEHQVYPVVFPTILDVNILVGCSTADTTIVVKWKQEEADEEHTETITDGGPEVTYSTSYDPQYVELPNTIGSFLGVGGYVKVYEDDGTTLVVDLTTVNVMAPGDNVYMVAVPQVLPDTYVTVEFNTDGGTLEPSQIIGAGTTATEPSTSPTKEGYTFVAWTNAEHEPFDFTAAITEDTVVYAVYNENP